MKKITFVLLVALVSSVAFAQSTTYMAADLVDQTVTNVRVNGMSLADFKASTGAVLSVGTTYTFEVDYLNQELTGVVPVAGTDPQEYISVDDQPNRVVIKTLNVWADVDVAEGPDITTADGSATVLFTPTSTEADKIQIRTWSSVFFNGTDPDNIFNTAWTLSIVDSPEKFSSFYPNPVNDVIHINNDVQVDSYKVFSITGALLKEIEGTSRTIDVSELKTGIYFLSAGDRVGKFIKE